MALVGYCGAIDRPMQAIESDFSRLTSLVRQPQLWCEGPTSRPHPANNTALAFVADGYSEALNPSAGLLYAGGSKATDRAGCGLVFTGVLFEPERIAAQCGVAETASDAALAAAWLERYGAEGLALALNQLEGDYALARWNPAQKRLLLAVAPMATRGLYYHHNENGLWFGSSLALLFRFPAVERTPSPSGIAIHLAGMVLDPTDTPFKDVHLLPGGRMIEAHPRGREHRTFWAPDPTHRLRLGHDQDYVEAARELLDQAVRVRLRGAHPPALSISGGLDSSGVAATAARLLPGVTLDTYTAIPSATAPLPTASAKHYQSEQGLVHAIADLHPTLRPQFVSSDSLAPFEDDPRPLFFASGAPAMVSTHLGWFDPVYRAVRADGHRTLLIGNFGNFGLSFDGVFCFADLLRQGRLDLVMRLLPPVMRFSKKPVLRAVRQMVGLVFPQAKHLWQRWHRRPSFLQDFSPLRSSAITELGLEQEMDRWGEEGILIKNKDTRALRSHVFHNRSARHIDAATLCRSHYGVDLLDPLADRRLLEFCLAIPVEQYVRDGRNRSLARRVLADRLPDCVINESRVGRQNPEWFSRMTRQREAFAADLERLEQSPLASSLIDLPRLKALLEDWPADAQAAEARRFDYESLLPRGVNMGRYLRWVEGGN